MVARLLSMLSVVAHAALDLQKYSAEESVAQWSATAQEEQLGKDMEAVKKAFEVLKSIATQESKLAVQLDGAKTLLNSMRSVHEEEGEITKQQHEVESLTAAHDIIEKELKTKKDQVESSADKLEKHAQCISRLSDLEVKVTQASVEYKRQRVEYVGQGINNLDDTFWTANDKLAKEAFNLFKEQKECAPSDVKIDPIPEPERCDLDTGGSCWVLSCRAIRHATCNTGMIANHKCLCKAGECSKDGVCVKRPNPLEAPTDVLTVEQVTLTREQTTLERPDPPKDLLANLGHVFEASRPRVGSVGPAGVPGVVPVLVCLVAMAVVLAVAAGPRSRSVREVRLPNTHLG